MRQNLNCLFAVINGEAPCFDYKQLTISPPKLGLWTITFSNPPINMFLPTTIVEFGSADYRARGGPVREGW